MAKKNYIAYVKRDKAPKRPRIHTKSVNKNKPKTKQKYRGQGR